MTAFDAVYYDGKTSARIPVRVHARGDSIVITGAQGTHEVALAAVRVEPPLGDIRRTLALPDGAQLQTDDHAAVAVLFPRAHRFQGWVQSLERRWGYALSAVIVIAAFTWWCLTYGLPAAATVVAHTIPPGVETTLGQQTLYTLDKSLCNPSELEARRIHSLQKRFDALVADEDDGYAYRLEFRSCPRIGPNAFALPGGTVVVTDALVKIARSDLQLAAVLAHEIGHVRLRHGLRIALQGAGAGILLAALAGDAIAITGLAVTLPTLLLQSGYSREFETEADTYAFKRMKEIGISPKHFAEIMMQIEAFAATQQPKKSGQQGKQASSGSAFDYLSTHPDTAARIKRALDNQ